MAKRFTDSEKWKKRFIRSLEAPYKLLWVYILDECNHAGIWDVDFDVAKIKLGLPDIKEETAVKMFNNKIQVFDNGDKWFIPSFIDWQYGGIEQLSEINRAHKSVIDNLKKHGLWQDLAFPTQSF